MHASRWAVGLISGTSMDGIDAALVRISGTAEWPRVRLRAFQTVPYPAAVARRLVRLASGAPTTAEEISHLNFVVGGLFAAAALAVCRQGRILPARLAVIGSHGQTVSHHGPGSGPAAADGQPSQRRASTLQIGEPAVIAEKTGVPVIADFRAADIAAGGQGAPLVPMIDYLLLRDAKLGAVALNLGGIANLTVIPASAKPENVFGFDTGPGNMVLDGLVRHCSRGRKTYDAGGRWARQGKLITPLLAEILRVPFFRRPPPKSAGREQFGSEFLERYFLKRRNTKPQDLLRTATELTAQSIAGALRRFVFWRAKIQRLIVSGGGAHNKFLLCRLSVLLPELVLQLSDRYGLMPDAKEAIAFALLADRTLHGLPGNLPAVTGARRPVVLGKLVRV